VLHATSTKGFETVQYIPGSATRKRAVENTAEKATIADENSLAVRKTWQRAEKGVVQGRVVNENEHFI